MLYNDYLNLALIFSIPCLLFIVILIGLGYRNNPQIFWAIILIGLTLPWIVGIIIKLYLQNQGKPTYPWSYFLNLEALFFLLPLTVWFALPFIGLALLHRFYIAKKSFAKLNSSISKLPVTIFAALGGIIGVVFTFTGVFWEFDMMYFFIPLWIFYLVTMLIGLIIGIFAGRFIEKLNNRF